LCLRGLLKAQEVYIKIWYFNFNKCKEAKRLVN
jgi:hypothetical protein